MLSHGPGRALGTLAVRGAEEVGQHRPGGRDRPQRGKQEGGQGRGAAEL